MEDVLFVPDVLPVKAKCKVDQTGNTSGGYTISQSVFPNFILYLDDDTKVQSRLAGRHMVGANFLCFDGHALYLNRPGILGASYKFRGGWITDNVPGQN